MYFLDNVARISKKSLRCIVTPNERFATKVAFLRKVLGVMVELTLDYTTMHTYDIESITAFERELDKLTILDRDFRAWIQFRGFWDHECSCEESDTLHPDGVLQSNAEIHGVYSRVEGCALACEWLGAENFKLFKNIAKAYWS